MTYSRDQYNRIKLGLEPRTTGPKPKKAIPRQSAKKKLEIKEEKERGGGKPPSKLALDKWFDDIKIKHWGTLGGYYHCMECGAFISYEYARHATAHLLPKKLFKSVSIHPENYLILGAGCGCHEKTHRIDKFVTMRIWPEAARKIKILIPLLPFDELKHLSSQLLTALDNTP